MSIQADAFNMEDEEEEEEGEGYGRQDQLMRKNSLHHSNIRTTALLLPYGSKYTTCLLRGLKYMRGRHNHDPFLGP